jgi:hypothetical protein
LRIVVVSLVFIFIIVVVIRREQAEFSVAEEACASAEEAAFGDSVGTGEGFLRVGGHAHAEGDCDGYY